MNKNLLMIVFAIILGTGTVTAQKNVGSYDYTTAFGVKFYPGALTLKHFVKENAAIEGIGYFWNRGTRITGLYEFHGNIEGAAGLKWYAGPGAHIGFYNNKYGGGTSFGVDGVLGLDYKIKDAPINLSVDWQPAFEFGNNYGNGFSGNWGGLAIRYVF